ncbi:hypothetical protein DFH08DRAFT_978308 [Mycena albidolilacea]|uniref:Uncharacterized protein n=1 Tax=Mycena albidolilacea TaxID=1033008 RepID=A0AAD7E8A7_9AGAR|nr:hypothetical protein DFH08DRAFT_978308 [Mycena albidolilacea]
MPYRRTAESTALCHRYISEYTSGGTNVPTLPQTDSDFDELPQSQTTPPTRKYCKNPKCRVEMPPDHPWQRCAACREKTRKVTAENKERRKHDAERDELIRSQASEISRLEHGERQAADLISSLLSDISSLQEEKRQMESELLDSLQSRIYEQQESGRDTNEYIDALQLHISRLQKALEAVSQPESPAYPSSVHLQDEEHHPHEHLHNAGPNLFGSLLRSLWRAFVIVWRAFCFLFRFLRIVAFSFAVFFSPRAQRGSSFPPRLHAPGSYTLDLGGSEVEAPPGLFERASSNAPASSHPGATNYSDPSPPYSALPAPGNSRLGTATRF